MKVIKRNEKILARNIININRKLNELFSRRGSVDDERIQRLEERIDKLQKSVEKLLEDVNYLKEQMKGNLTTEDLAQLKYIVDTINPLELVTYDQVGELVEKKLREMRIIR